MILNIIYIILAIVGLGFLIFIHELGHYFAAKKAKMKIETFSIGFGKPIYSFYRSGVKWQIGILPFGGFVKIAGMQKEGDKEPYEIEDGFFGKKPLARMKVAFSGPFVNLAFAFIAFAFIWSLGGRTKSFSEYTHYMGWVDPKSSLYEGSVNAGDEIVKCNDRDYKGFQDLIYGTILNGNKMDIKGYHHDFYKKTKRPFDTIIKKDNNSKDSVILSTLGSSAPASYLIYKNSNKENVSNSLMEQLKNGDRILWVDGEFVFSRSHLDNIINSEIAFMTIQRDENILHIKVPKVKVQDLRLSKLDLEQYDDWKHETNLKDSLEDLYCLPYYFNENCIVENRLDFVDDNLAKEIFVQEDSNTFQNILKRGDKILAVDGKTVNLGYEILQHIQTRNALIIVENQADLLKKISWKKADIEFNSYFDPNDLLSIISSIGVSSDVKEAGNLRLLQSVTAKPFSEIAGFQEQFEKQYIEMKKEIEKMKNPVKKKIAMQQLEKSKTRLVLGVPYMYLHDRQISYNPNPFLQFVDVFKDVGKTLGAFMTGSLSPKYMSGPIGIVQVVHYGWSLGFKEALFWLAIISLNLGIVNLLPLPALDGGYILFSIIELITKKPLKAKTMEKIIIPFFVLLVLGILYFLYQDISRIFGGFF